MRISEYATEYLELIKGSIDEEVHMIIEECLGANPLWSNYKLCFRRSFETKLCEYHLNTGATEDHFKKTFGRSPVMVVRFPAEIEHKSFMTALLEDFVTFNEILKAFGLPEDETLVSKNNDFFVTDAKTLESDQIAAYLNGGGSIGSDAESTHGSEERLENRSNQTSEEEEEESYDEIDVELEEDEHHSEGASENPARSDTFIQQMQAFTTPSKSREVAATNEEPDSLHSAESEVATAMERAIGHNNSVPEANHEVQLGTHTPQILPKETYDSVSETKVVTEAMQSFNAMVSGIPEFKEGFARLVALLYGSKVLYGNEVKVLEDQEYTEIMAAFESISKETMYKAFRGTIRMLWRSGDKEMVSKLLEEVVFYLEEMEGL
jgi:hypothetical protein